MNNEQKEHQLRLDNHVKFLQRFLHVCPEKTIAFDSNRPTLLFFVLHGLVTIKRLHLTGNGDQTRDDLVPLKCRCVNCIEPSVDGLEMAKSAVCQLDWTLRVHLVEMLLEFYVSDGEIAGFSGSLMTTKETRNQDNDKQHHLEAIHLTNTYTALACLMMVGYRIDRLDFDGILRAVGRMQLNDGSLLNNFSTVNVERLRQFILNSQSYEGGFAKRPGCEAHGAYTFCAIASLYLLEKHIQGKSKETTVVNWEDCPWPTEKRLRCIEWLAFRQTSQNDNGDTDAGYGLHGRPGKDVDSCYLFWIIGATKLLNCETFVDRNGPLDFALTCQSYGGFQREPVGPDHPQHPDPLHTCLALGGLCFHLNGRSQLDFESLDVALNLADYLLVGRR